MLSLRTIVGYIARRKWDLLCVLLLVFLAAEINLRMPWARQLEYHPDVTLGAILEPNQTSPTTRVNSDGHRGEDTDPSKPVIVAVGDSQGWGSGVLDHEVWTTRLQERLRTRNSDLRDIQVVNACHPGFGPYQQYVRLQRAMKFRDIRAILVRTSIEDRTFTASPKDDMNNAYESAKFRYSVRKVTKFLPSCYSRGKEQLRQLSATLNLSSQPRPLPAKSEEAGLIMWKSQSQWWKKMLELAKERNIPIVFFIHDPIDYPSSAILNDRLKELVEEERYGRVVRIGSEDFQISNWAEYRQRYTFRHDHHGNNVQHDLIGKVLYEYLVERHVLETGTQLASIP